MRKVIKKNNLHQDNLSVTQSTIPHHNILYSTFPSLANLFLDLSLLKVLHLLLLGLHLFLHT